MATATKYAWTPIVYVDSDGKRATAAPGEAVTAKSLNVSDEEFDELVAARAVRDKKFPDMPADFTGSPYEYMVQEVTRQLAVAEDALSEDDAMLEVTRTAESETG